MKTSIKFKNKQLYSVPKIEQIELDKRISLALESTPPEGPNELTWIKSGYFNHVSLNDNIL